MIDVLILSSAPSDSSDIRSVALMQSVQRIQKSPGSFLKAAMNNPFILNAQTNRALISPPHDTALHAAVRQVPVHLTWPGSSRRKPTWPEIKAGRGVSSSVMAPPGSKPPPASTKPPPRFDPLLMTPKRPALYALVSSDLSVEISSLLEAADDKRSDLAAFPALSPLIFPECAKV